MQRASRARLRTNRYETITRDAFSLYCTSFFFFFSNLCYTDFRYHGVPEEEASSLRKPFRTSSRSAWFPIFLGRLSSGAC